MVKQKVPSGGLGQADVIASVQSVDEPFLASQVSTKNITDASSGRSNILHIVQALILALCVFVMLKRRSTDY